MPASLTSPPRLLSLLIPARSNPLQDDFTERTHKLPSVFSALLFESAQTDWIRFMLIHSLMSCMRISYQEERISVTVHQGFMKKKRKKKKEGGLYDTGHIDISLI